MGHRRVTAGDAVLTQGSGGVSVFALQLATVLGARVIATTSTAEKAERLSRRYRGRLFHRRSQFLRAALFKVIGHLVPSAAMYSIGRVAEFPCSVRGRSST
jgi:NADPH:quinone reductase-like Zn-dependent oxidoreductase